MKRLPSRVAVVIGLAMALSLALYWVLTPRPGPVSRAIGKVVDERLGQPVKISDLTQFSWDEMLTIGPYVTDNGRAQWCEHWAVTTAQCEEIEFAPVSEGWVTLVFRHSGAVIHSEPHARINGDFYPASFTLPLMPSDAVFDVMLVDGNVTESGQLWRYLVRHGEAGPRGSKLATLAAGGAR